MEARTNVRTQTVTVGGLDIFFREAGPPDAPAVLLLHGFPSSSHMFRGLLPALAGAYRVVAPDLPGFGFSSAPSARDFPYTFARLAEAMAGFTDAVGLASYALYVFDYGAPVGFRLALAQPGRVRALVTQNGNAYEEGLSEAWAPIRAYWREPTAARRDALRAFLTADATRWQYEHGAPDPARVAPEAYALDQARLDRPGNDEAQLDLFLDYASNVALYPSFQALWRERRLPVLAVWGRHDPFFLPAGAEAYRRDAPDAEVHFLNAGHFALETHLDAIVGHVRPFLARALDGEGLFAGFGEGDAGAGGDAALARARSAFGFVPNLAVAMAACPPALDAYLGGLRELGESSLSEAEQALVMLVASRVNDAPYGVAVHATLGARAGLPDDAVRAARAGEAPADPKLAALARFAGAFASHRGRVSPADVAAFRAAGYGRDAAVAVALAVALKTFANGVAHLARPALDRELGGEAAASGSASG